MKKNYYYITLDYITNVYAISSLGCVRGSTVNDVGLIKEVNQRRARLVLGWVTGKLSRYVISQLGRLSLPCFRHR